LVVGHANKLVVGLDGNMYSARQEYCQTVLPDDPAACATDDPVLSSSKAATGKDVIG
jgi:hypothetical protein